MENVEKGTAVLKNLKKGNFVLIDDVPCKVVSVNISKSGKHGAAKCRLEGMGLFDNRRRNVIKPADAKIDTPVVLRKQGQVLAIVGEKVQVMDLTDYSNFEIEIPEDMKGSVNPGEEITYYEVFGVRTLEKLR
ncbi:translation initiation factor IF-5A [Candidatus Micrarchaeota archaeon RBG_16_49_10]|nr:MAG: translation initiation factor IF-5A [Candidatus Micrarchaeota archaeon RBG_16_49_10]